MEEWINLATTANAGAQFSLDCFILSSKDTRRWCNSMFSNNIRNLQAAQGNLSAICDDRGRVQGLVDVYCIDSERFLCVLDGVDNEWFLKRFSMYMILDDIEQEELQEELFHLCGPTAKQILRLAGFTLPTEGQQYAQNENIHIFHKNRFGIDGFDIITNDLDQLRENLSNHGLNHISEEDFDALRILHGKARWPHDGNDKSMIHELKLNEE